MWNSPFRALTGNKFQKLTKGSFKGLSNLNSLYLDDNEITCIIPGAFDGLDSLKSL
jgi:hypothetical protein